MDDFERKKTLDKKEEQENNLKKKFLTDSLAEMSQIIFAYSLVLGILGILVYFEKKKLEFLVTAPPPPPFLADASIKNSGWILI